MKKNILLEIERNREIMGLKPFIMEGINLLITESIDPFKLWEKLFERTTETEVEEAITRNSRIFEIGGEKLEEKIANRGSKTTREVVEEFLTMASRDTEKFVEMINKLSIELPSFATDLAIKVGENTINFGGNQVPIYEVLQKWWEIHGAEVNSVDKFKEVCKKLSESLDIPSDTMNKLRQAAIYGEVTGISTSGDAVVDDIIAHFGGSTGEKTLEGVGERELAELIEAISQQDMEEYVEDILNNGSMVLLDDGTINVNSETLIDYCLNAAPPNVRKYFRVKFKIPQTNMDIPVPFTNIPMESRKLVNKELELIRGGLMNMRKSPETYNKILEEINKHVERKISPSVFKEILEKYCYGSKTKGSFFGDIANLFRNTPLPTTKGFKGLCEIVRVLLVVKAIEILIVEFDLNVGVMFQTAARVAVVDLPNIIREIYKDYEGLITEDDTDLIALFYQQHPESNNPDNTRFKGKYKGGYFEVKIEEPKMTIYGEQKVLSDWKIVKYVNGNFKFEDSKSWWEETKEKATEKVQDIKQDVDSLRQQQ
jgi:hypothetical protein